MSLLPQIQQYCDQLVREFDQISEDRKALLSGLSRYIREKTETESPIDLIVICTHNSRRSHMGQVWLSLAADYYGIKNVSTYSGGTEGTAFYPSAVAALQKVGLDINKSDDSTNPNYNMKWNTEMDVYSAFSKRYDASPNPQHDFGAVLVCTSADKGCPIVAGCDFRLALPYHDPKAFDATDLEDAKYEERCRDIGREMMWMMSQV